MVSTTCYVSIVSDSKMPKVNIIGWRPGLQKISMTHVLQERLGLGLKDAKGAVDAVLAGESIAFTLEDSTDAASLVQALVHIGAEVELIDDDKSLRASSADET